MIAIIIGLLITLVVLVVVVSAFQQHKEKQDAEKRVKVAKQKAIMDESEELILNLVNLPSSPKLTRILANRSLTAATTMRELKPEVKGLEDRINALKAQIKAAEELTTSQGNDENFVLPENEQQVLAVLQCIKKLRVIIKSEQKKGALDPQTFTQEDQRLDAMQLKINIESLMKRGIQAQNKEMFGSARQYFEKALQTMANHPIKTDYINTKTSEIEQQLEDITDSLKTTNASDAAKRAKEEENELDILFQPKKKW
ncbi:hypothetical protein Q4506_11225 [Colwellia sp. 4_MG-2023]|jgi:flagellar basal body-associated protein FliL|uniref:hypothetical protein n=1 Tax=unclassified Colwellia TaxID=196834 RepID=UPI001C080226|nr:MULTISPECIES: hypothetical protein [unclassified Colwellia]MBU2925669.1 hypothetical protein [Colwellia sp. C2M11]MDO6487848.1 hypothetical protein [Colwellia sp. 6_MG-2023]MDO6507483.1 hypothetical protein [Colwellia sp. 5_MG-2023]MDO6556259.1 hypothetical protein [Colwellia sp. 4_MG-2023]MDO6651105.1 hypothetical protein [Colwellia sp. 3_MG-2023]